ncbi:MAG: bifunctional deaminase-reductase domain protein [Nocardioides sp.]|nr:bifunctional deaminase-reductase domain protein [Nocardioides sp.]
MSRVIADITMSLDGFVTGPGAGPEAGLGLDSDGLHAWAIDSDDPVDRGLLEELTAASGAVIMGRNTFDVIDGPRGWNEEMGYGADQVGKPPFFVLTGAPPGRTRLPLDWTFVTDGPASAVRQALAVAGDKDVYIMGGGATIAACLEAGVVDRLRVHLSPELLGAGTPLFAGTGRHRLVQRDVRVSRVATHVLYDVSR